MEMQMKKIVIVGGGAGGLELATKLFHYTACIKLQFMVF
jgi:NADH dehydrogenase FAD-containing subunit